MPFMLSPAISAISAISAAAPPAHPADDPVLARAVAMRPKMCERAHLSVVGRSASHRIKAKLDGDEGLTLHGVPCDSGAYNLVYVFFTQSEKGEYRNIGFAEPDTEYVRATDSAPAAAHLIGWRSTDVLVNPEWNPAAQTLTTFSRARGAGDAGDRGVWGFDRGRSTLRYYERDFTYDGQYTPKVFFAVEDMAKLPPPPQHD
jgi:hypothetical protein